VGSNREEARRAARLQIAFYATTPSYKAILEMHDARDLPRSLRRAFVSHDWIRWPARGRRVLDAIAVTGTPVEAADRIRAWEGAAERVILGVPWYGLDAASQRRALEGSLIGACWREYIASPRCRRVVSGASAGSRRGASGAGGCPWGG
jgi:alkanesulfonate monooxygenase SsuD/methylene tetrahydromethanopterin reductase-like flavin-dependent oxidoreductase (luciferase family)